MGNENQKLTETEQEVYDLWVGENLSPKEISKRRGTNDSITYRHLRSCKKKGFTKGKKVHSTKKGVPVSTLIPKKLFWRYHKLHFLVYPYHFYPRYQGHMGKINEKHGSWRVTLHKDMVEFRLRKDHDIKHIDKWECIELTRELFNKRLYYVSQQYGFEYLKDRKANIKCVDGHLAQGNSDISEIYAGRHLLVKGEDGKVWFELDMSETYEHEYRHPRDHISDSEQVEPFIKEMRDPTTMTNRQLQTMVTTIVKNQHTFSENLVKHVSAIDELKRLAGNINKVLVGGEDFLSRSGRSSSYSQESLLYYM